MFQADVVLIWWYVSCEFVSEPISLGTFLLLQITITLIYTLTIIAQN